MNINELVEQLEDGDLYRCKSTSRGDWTDYKGGFGPFYIEDIKADDWEIKKKEEKPISAEIIVTNYISWRQKKESLETGEDAQRFNIFGEKDMLNLVELAEKNNDLKYKKLVKTLKFMAIGNGVIDDHSASTLLLMIK